MIMAVNEQLKSSGEEQKKNKKNKNFVGRNYAITTSFGIIDLLTEISPE